MSTHTSIWITWEHQRRSVVLSKEFGADFHELLSSKKGLNRYLILSYKTVHSLIRIRPSLLFVQNPSILLTLLACFYRMFSSRTILVVDRHSNFFPISRSAIVNILHNKLSNFTLKRSDLTIVTNEFLKHLVESLGGKAIVLEDKIPKLHKNKDLQLQGKHNVLYICSFDNDEPFEEVFKAAELLSSDTFIHMTGNYHKIKNERLPKRVPNNLLILGFLPENDFVDHLYSVDAVMVLTDWDHTILCGAYEAVCAEKPMILSNKRALLDYFNKGVVKTDNYASSIANAIEQTIKAKDNLVKDVRILKDELNREWQIKFKKVNQIINTIEAGKLIRKAS